MIRVVSAIGTCMLIVGRVVRADGVRSQAQ